MLNTTLLSSLSNFTREFERCCREYEQLEIATAWCGNPKHGYGLPFNHLQSFNGKITTTVGTSFSHTHPDGIEFLRTIKADLRIFKDDVALFHPKVYLFSSGDQLALFVGSSNLTFSGFYANTEINVLIEGKQTASGTHQIDELRRELKRWHSDPLSFKPSDAWLSAYRKKFERNRNAEKKLPVETPLQYEEHLPPASWLTTATWETYYQKVVDGVRQHKRDKDGMLKFFETVGKQLPLPWSVPDFDVLENRRIIEGLGKYGCFGHVGASGKFRKLLVKGTTAKKSQIVNAINDIGTLSLPIDWDRLKRLLDTLVSAGPSMKVWSRQLCMIHPDFYCTVASPSVRKQLSDVLDMPQSHFESTQGYIKLLKLIHASPWFQAPVPKDADEAAIWHRRTAFLDAIIYE